MYVCYVCDVCNACVLYAMHCMRVCMRGMCVCMCVNKQKRNRSVGQRNIMPYDACTCRVMHVRVVCAKCMHACIDAMNVCMHACMYVCLFGYVFMRCTYVCRCAI